MDKRKQKITIHMIGNAHLDPVWLWAQNEGKLSAMQTATSAADRMNETPEFTFSCSSASMYKWIEEEDKPLFKKIKKYVKNGQWEIVGGWWVQPDCNLPSGESFIRQGYYGKLYFREKFGVDVKVGYNVDSFGHTGGLPQILKQLGIDYYVFFRPPLADMNMQYGYFHWQSPDGSKVVAVHPPLHYNTGAFPEDDIDMNTRIPESVKGRPEYLKDIACFYGVGNHGGGPTKKHIRTIQNFADPEGVIEPVFSRLDSYFETISPLFERLPVKQRELQFHARGCYSVHSGIKKWNRLAENRLLASEKLAAVAWLYNNKKYPHKFYSDMWEILLFNQFHDILAGTSIRVVYVDAEKEFARLFTRTARKTAGLLNQFTGRSAETDSVLLFNPLSFARKEIIPLPSGFAGIHNLTASYGKAVPVQKSGKKKYALVNLNGMSFDLLKAASGEYAGENSCLSVTESRMENDYFKLTFDGKTGAITGLYNKTGRCEMLTAPANLPEIYRDKSDTWGHEVDTFDDFESHAEFHRIRIIDEGPLFCSVDISWKYRKSRILLKIRLYRDLPYIDCFTRICWAEKNRLLKFGFPLKINNPAATFEMAYSTVTRPPDGTEVPMQQWFDLTGSADGKQAGMSIINDGKYSGSVKDATMYLTVLRSPGFAHHIPDPGRHVPDNEYIDQGVQEFIYRLYPHAGSWQESKTPNVAASLNSPVAVKKSTAGMLENDHCTSVMTIEPDTVHCTAIKAAKDDGGTIFRLYETSGQPCICSVKIAGILNVKELSFRSHEIKTIKVYKMSAGSFSFKEVNALEE